MIGTGTPYFVSETVLLRTTAAGALFMVSAGASECIFSSAMPMIDATFVTIWYQAGTSGFFVRLSSHATTNCVVPPKIVTERAYIIASPLERTDFGNASSRKA